MAAIDSLFHMMEPLETSPMPTHAVLVGIDMVNSWLAGTPRHPVRVCYVATNSTQRIAFVSRAHSASTVTARIAGYREALYACNLRPKEEMVREGDPADPAFVRRLLAELRPDAILCANDLLAGRLIATLGDLGVDVPREMQVAGVDDVKYASLLPVPLTTQHQNCHEIGAMALATMLDRVANPAAPVRDILLQTTTIVRSSCGAKR